MLLKKNNLFNKVSDLLQFIIIVFQQNVNNFKDYYHLVPRVDFSGVKFNKLNAQGKTLGSEHLAYETAFIIRNSGIILCLYKQIYPTCCLFNTYQLLQNF